MTQQFVPAAVSPAASGPLKMRGAFRGGDFGRAAMKRFGLAVLALAGAPTVAKAQLACVANITPITFDTITAASAGTYDARGMITVTCTGSQGANIAACVDLGQGSVSASGQRLLSGPKASSSLPIRLFQDATLTRPWGSAVMGQAPILQRTGDGPMTAIVYARLYVQEGTAVPGTYSAQFPITLRYGTITGDFANCNTLGSGAIASQKPAVTAIPRKR